MATPTALSTSLPHLPPRRVTPFPSSSASAAVPLHSRAARLRESRLAAAAPTVSEALDSANGAIPTAAKSGAARGYGREYFPLAAVVGQVRSFCCVWVRRFACSINGSGPVAVLPPEWSD
jgi:magnesium chelatase subunit D